ncbi:MAG TPA: anion transporter [Terriglobales bacterium]|nr:anion transporter [Terriglobales bacterium]
MRAAFLPHLHAGVARVLAPFIASAQLHLLLAYGVFLASYLVFAIGRFPGTKIDRPAAAVIGAALMFAFRAITPSEAIRSIDYATIVLLASMMLIVSSLHFAGFFEWVAKLVVKFVSPAHLLPGVIFTSGILSAFLVNDVICLMMAPLLLKICRQFSKRPTPYLLALATASNIGSAATITGNPQNILIGSISAIGYRQFISALAPVSLIGLFIDWAVLHWLYPDRGLAPSAAPPAIAVENSGTDRQRLAFPLVILAGVLAGFFAGVSPALVAAIGGALLLVRRSIHPENIYKEIDWPLLVFFIGLFLIIGAAQQAGIAQQMLAIAERLNLHNGWIFSGVVALLSNVVSNVPAVMLLKSLVPQFQNATHFWLLLAMASTLAGNLTITGSIANIIVVEKARKEVEITFADYARVGIPVTLATLAVGVLWLRCFA